MRIAADADCLAALMVLDTEIGMEPEPFRMQPNLQISIDFEEYLKFVRALPPHRHILNSETYRIQEALAIQNERILLKSFYADMALAVCKELFFAEGARKEATEIRHTFCDLAPSKSITVDAGTPILLTSICEIKKYYIALPISVGNRSHWEYACKLLQDVTDGPTRWIPQLLHGT
jgi:hypothetical protein